MSYELTYNQKIGLSIVAVLLLVALSMSILYMLFYVPVDTEVEEVEIRIENVDEGTQLEVQLSNTDSIDLDVVGDDVYVYTNYREGQPVALLQSGVYELRVEDVESGGFVVREFEVGGEVEVVVDFEELD